MNTCNKCDGKGVYAAGNGPDDMEVEFCHCEVGVHAKDTVMGELAAHAN